MFGDSKLTNLKHNQIKEGELKGSLNIITKYLYFNRYCIFFWKANSGGKCGRSRGCQSLKIYHDFRWKNVTCMWNYSFSFLYPSFHRYQAAVHFYDS